MTGSDHEGDGGWPGKDRFRKEWEEERKKKGFLINDKEQDTLESG